MRRFKFTLDSVLMLREKSLEDERIKLADIIRFFEKQKEVLSKLKENLKTLIENKSSFLNESFNPQLVNNYNMYVQKITNDISIQKENLKKVELDLDRQKEEVKKAYVKVKILEKLKEKQKDNYNKEFLLEELKFLDDLAVSKKRA